MARKFSANASKESLIIPEYQKTPYYDYTFLKRAGQMERIQARSML